jgi:hypothetical protein
VLDLRAFGAKRQFYEARAEADAERMRQLTALERHGRDAVGLPQRELSNFITAKRTLASYGKTISDAVDYHVDHLESVRRCKTTIAELMAELFESAGIWTLDIRSADYLAHLIANATNEELILYSHKRARGPASASEFDSVLPYRPIPVGI